MESSTGSKRTTASYARGGMHALFHRSGRGLGDLKDRVALVTRASGGLGATIARRLDHEGAQRVLSGRRQGELSALAAELGGKTRVVTVRATHPEVTPPQVTDACVEAIHTNRAEILVAPRTQRLAVRVAGLFPELMQPVLRSSVVPPEAVAAQQRKR